MKTNYAEKLKMYQIMKQRENSEGSCRSRRIFVSEYSSRHYDVDEVMTMIDELNQKNDGFYYSIRVMK